MCPRNVRTSKGGEKMSVRENYEAFLLYIDKDLKRQLEKEAREFGISLSLYIRRLLYDRKGTMFYDRNIKKQG